MRCNETGDLWLARSSINDWDRFRKKVTLVACAVCWLMRHPSFDIPITPQGKLQHCQILNQQ